MIIGAFRMHRACQTLCDAGVLPVRLGRRPAQPVLARVVAAVGAIVLLNLSGGFRTVVSADRLVLRMGHLGVPLLCLPLRELEEAGVHTFSALADLGGWGIRRRGGTTGYFLAGNTGVLLHTKRRRYLIGASRPERLAAVVDAARTRPRRGTADAS